MRGIDLLPVTSQCATPRIKEVQVRMWKAIPNVYVLKTDVMIGAAMSMLDLEGSWIIFDMPNYRSSTE